MAKDDYYVIAGKILVYLYARLKGKQNIPPEQFLHGMSKEFPVSEEYFDFVLDEIHDHGYIKMQTVKDWGGETVLRDIDSIRITQEGIDFLSENSKIRKVLKMIPMAASIAELFQ